LYQLEFEFEKNDAGLISLSIWNNTIFAQHGVSLFLQKKILTSTDGLYDFSETSCVLTGGILSKQDQGRGYQFWAISPCTSGAE
jgi:hypothetical protein